MEDDVKQEQRPCGCTQKCNFGACFGTGQMGLIMKTETGFETTKTIKAVARNGDGSFYAHRFCKDKNDWVKEDLDMEKVQAIVAP